MEMVVDMIRLIQYHPLLLVEQYQENSYNFLGIYSAEDLSWASLDPYNVTPLRSQALWEGEMALLSLSWQ